jgi:hypothetical protein
MEVNQDGGSRYSIHEAKRQFCQALVEKASSFPTQKGLFVSKKRGLCNFNEKPQHCEKYKIEMFLRQSWNSTKNKASYAVYTNPTRVSMLQNNQ